MILDYYNNPGGAVEKKFMYGKVLVDGCEIRLCFQVNTEAGIVRTYDVLGDGITYMHHKLPLAIKLTTLSTESGIAYKEIHGKVEAYTADGDIANCA